MKTLLIYLSLALWSLPLVAEDMAGNIDVSVKLSLKTKYLGKLGTTVDDSSVLQPYVELNHKSGLYAYLWLNLPLREGNPKRSLEVEPSLGYRKAINDWTMDLSLTLFDIQNPRVLDFDGDILGSRIKLSNRYFLIESIYYAADSGRDGLLGGMGIYKNFKHSVSVSANINYADGPFHFQAIAYAKFKAQISLENSPIDLFVEVLEIMHKTSASETRKDQVALGLSYSF